MKRPRQPYEPRLHRGVKKLARPLVHELERAWDQFEEPLDRIEHIVHDLAVGQGMDVSPDSHLAPGIPRVRPVLVLLANKAAGGGDASAAEAAFSAELLHRAIRAHDKALGRQDGRRRRVARRLIGGAAHWLSGHHLTLRALEVARSAPGPELMGEVLDSMREICEGHQLAEDLRSRDPSEADYRDYAEGHIGAVYSFCGRAGGHLAKADPHVVSALGRYGRRMGVAWHAMEDQWTLSLPEEEFVRVLARSAATGRPILPLITSMQQDPALDPLLDSILATGNHEEASEFRDRIIASGGLFSTRRVMAEESLGARRALRELDPSEARDTLERIASGLAKSAA
jgi:octaprenyl-diphosphate synthase